MSAGANGRPATAKLDHPLSASDDPFAFTPQYHFGSIDSVSPVLIAVQSIFTDCAKVPDAERPLNQRTDGQDRGSTKPAKASSLFTPLAPPEYHQGNSAYYPQPQGAPQYQLPPLPPPPPVFSPPLLPVGLTVPAMIQSPPRLFSQSSLPTESYIPVDGMGCWYPPQATFEYYLPPGPPSPPSAFINPVSCSPPSSTYPPFPNPFLPSLADPALDNFAFDLTATQTFTSTRTLHRPEHGTGTHHGRLHSGTGKFGQNQGGVHSNNDYPGSGSGAGVDNVVPNEKNQLDLAKIESGGDTRTTVMIKNIPNKMSDRDLLNFINKVTPRKIDFLYLRMDFQNGK